MYVCMHVHMYVCMYVCTSDVCIYVCMYVCMYETFYAYIRQVSGSVLSQNNGNPGLECLRFLEVSSTING